MCDLPRVAAALTLALQKLQPLEDVALDLFAGVVRREKAAEILPPQFNLFLLVGFLLLHECLNGVAVKCSGLGCALELNGLGMGRGTLVFLHGGEQFPLLFLGEIGQLHRRIEGDLALVHLGEYLRDEVGQTDETLDLPRTIRSVFCHFFICSQLRANLARSSLMLHTNQNQLLTMLKQQGLVDSDLFISRSNAIAEQLRKAKQEKNRIMETAGDETVQQTQELMDDLSTGPDFIETFDSDLFDALVDRIIVEDAEHISFQVKNGLRLREQVERMRR